MGVSWSSRWLELGSPGSHGSSSVRLPAAVVVPAGDTCKAANVPAWPAGRGLWSPLRLSTRGLLDGRGAPGDGKPRAKDPPCSLCGGVSPWRNAGAAGRHLLLVSLAV